MANILGILREDGYHAEWVDIPTDEEGRLDRHLGYDLASCAREEYINRHMRLPNTWYPSTARIPDEHAFSFVTSLQYDLTHYLFEHCLTELGQRLLVAYKAKYCADENGEMDLDATYDYWCGNGYGSNLLLLWKDFFLSSTDDWTVPIQEEIMMRVFRGDPVPLNQQGVRKGKRKETIGEMIERHATMA